MATGNLVNGDTTLNSTFTLNKATNTLLTLQTAGKYIEKVIELTLNAQTASPSFDGGALNNKAATATFTNMTTSASNTSGVAIVAAGAAGRDAVLYNGAVEGWVSKADNESASAAVSTENWTGTTYYATGITMTTPSSGTRSFSITVPNGANNTATFTFNVDTNGNTVIGDDTIEPPSYVALNEATPDQISAIAKADLGSSYWAVGDKTALINISAFGNMEATSISAFIIGFDHNNSIEGSGIHFIIGKNASNKQLSLCDSGYFTDKTSGIWFNMNNSTSNSGGWESSNMRTTICAALYNALPSAWQNIIVNCTKYTDNTGGGSNTAAYVTSTSDKIFLPSEWEIHGVRTNGNSAEQNYQNQYDYYANGGNKIYYKSNDTSNVSGYWTRSPVASSSSDFCRVNGSGQSVTYAANRSMGFTPCFKVA